MTRAWWLALIVALAAVAVAAVVLWPRPQAQLPTRTPLGIPPVGGVAAAFTPDGHPVWVITHGDRTISVVDALSSHAPFGIGKVTWWCATSRLIEDPFHGSRYDEFGNRIAGPAQDGLRTYAFEIDGQYLVIEQPLSEDPAGGRPRPVANPDALATCVDPAETLVHDYGSAPIAETPADAATLDDGWRRVRATLVPVPREGSGLLCAGAAVDEACVQVELPGIEHLLAQPDRAASSVNAWTDTDWLIHVVGGTIVEIVLLGELAD